MKDRERATRSVSPLVSDIVKILDTLPEKSLQTVYYFVRRLAQNYHRDRSSDPSPS